MLNYNPQGEPADVIKEMIATILNHGAQPVLLNMTLSDHYFAYFDNLVDYPEYLDALEHAAHDMNVTLWDMQDLAPEQQFWDSEFGDLNPIGYRGAERLTTLLAHKYASLVAEKNNQVFGQ